MSWALGVLSMELFKRYKYYIYATLFLLWLSSSLWLEYVPVMGPLVKVSLQLDKDHPDYKFEIKARPKEFRIFAISRKKQKLNDIQRNNIADEMLDSVNNAVNTEWSYVSIAFAQDRSIAQELKSAFEGKEIERAIGTFYFEYTNGD